MRVLVRLKRWTDWDYDGISRENWDAAKGTVKLFLALGNEKPEITADAEGDCIRKRIAMLQEARTLIDELIADYEAA